MLPARARAHMLCLMSSSCGRTNGHAFALHVKAKVPAQRNAARVCNTDTQGAPKVLPGVCVDQEYDNDHDDDNDNVGDDDDDDDNNKYDNTLYNHEHENESD